MRFILVKPAEHRLQGKISLLGDKSIANRSIIISAISQGKTTVKNFPANKDCLTTIRVFRKLGIKIRQYSQDKNTQTITVFGKGLRGLKKPQGPIFAGDSGTTLRLTLGVLAGQRFSVTLNAGAALSQRPMRRVTVPLRMMGAEISARHISKTKNLIPNTKFEEYPPITIKGVDPKPITYNMPLASAQVKSAILFAGLYARGTTRVIEPIKTRDHTERMLRLFKARIKLQQNTVVIKGNRELVSPGQVLIPADISSASFFIVAATILAGSRVLIKNVNLNPSRMGIIRVLKRMGACIKNQKEKTKIQDYEPRGDLIVEGSPLRGTVIKREEIPSLIDELPILMVAACYARGRTVFEGAGELRVKETDRIRSMSDNLRKMGAHIKVMNRGGGEKIIIQGAEGLRGASVASYADHRTAMSMIIAALRAKGATRIDDVTCINKSFPNFLSLLQTLLN
ncbi:MAG: 3-phosphoshikimate 1-carboxyvinyltransferase [Candidatus Omnitrophota bacterium]